MPAFRDVLFSPPRSVPPDVSLDAARRAIEKGDAKALVVAIGGRILGVLTTDDIERARATGLDLTRARVCEAMSPAFVVASDEKLTPIARRMTAEGIGFVVVVDREDGGVCGLFALADVHGLGVAAPTTPPPFAG